MILSHFLCRAVEYRKRVNLMLITGDISRHSQFNFECAFNLLEMKRYNCMIIGRFLEWKDTITATWLWDTLSTGGQALRRRLKFADDDDHTSLAVVDYTSTGMPRSMSYEFSACYFDRKIGRNNLDARFHEGLPINNAVSNIEYSIRVTGCRNLMMSRSFFVYCDAFKMCDVLGNIYFPFPMRHAGTKEERRKKIFVDFMGKAIGHR
ncbi:hypothetical protein F2Q68_00012466 [Brassica cretica]|uniref:Uncharacterized protein n=1 Tax=Brassica cretica TaxID=69181 RepID=A0A8S9L278_BRACR|nr:hypothetical protein F2Q68_00012466 [Brassica cretica]